MSKFEDFLNIYIGEPVAPAAFDAFSNAWETYNFCEIRDDRREGHKPNGAHHSIASYYLFI